MTDEPKPEMMDDDMDDEMEDLDEEGWDDFEDTDIIEVPDTVGSIQDTMEYFFETGSVDAVYGDPVEHDDNLIIPSAEVLSVMGFGLGYGSGTNPKENQEGTGGGGGGGGRVLARPVAVIISSPGGVRVEPVLDVTKIALAALTAAGFMIGMLARMSRSPKSMGDVDFS